MRKLISVCVAAAIVISMFALTPIVSSAAEPAKLFDFYSQSLFDSTKISGEYQCSVTWQNNALHYIANTAEDELGDTYFSLGVGSGFDAGENQWMVIKLKNLSEVKTFEMHYGTTLHPIAGNTVAHFDISAKDTDYKTYVINVADANLKTAYALNGPDGIAQKAGSTNAPISELTESTFEGTLNSLRFDCLYAAGASGEVPDGSELYIEYAAFFGSESDAKAFAQTGPTNRSDVPATPTAAPVTGDEAKPNYDAVIIFKEDGDWEDYISIGEGAAAQDVTFDGFNDAGDAIVLSVLKSNDPWITFNMLAPVDAEEWPVMQIKLKKSDSTVNSGQIYYTTSVNGNLQESQTATAKYKNSADWQYANIDLNELDNGLCTGDYTALRFDVFSNCPADCTVEVAYIAFFKSVAAAEQFAANGAKFEEGPATATPAAASPTTKATAKPTSSAKAATPTPKSTEKTGMSTTTIVIIIVAAVVVVGGGATAVILIMKKKKANK